MPDLMNDFQSLPDEYQQVIRQAQENYQIRIAPLQLLVGGWSGAIVYLVSVSANDSGLVEHCILKLDRKGKSSKSDEVTRHAQMLSKASSEFAREYIAELVFERVEHEGAVAIFYRIAGQSLLNYRPLSSYGRESQLKTIFSKTNQVLLEEWNGNMSFKQAVHPQKVLEKWLGFRLDAGGNIERFLQGVCRVDPEVGGLLIAGNVFPNPLVYARKEDCWGRSRPIDIALGFIHGDLNTNNILVKFGEDNESLEGYYLIDFALYKEQMPLLYDQRYLEMSYLALTMGQVSFPRLVDLLTLIAEANIPEAHQAPIELSGASAVIATARRAFAAWVDENHPSLVDDLWAQYWLAGAAAGLSYCHKAGQADEIRLAGLIYAAANLKRYSSLFALPTPTEVELLFDESQLDSGSPGGPASRKPRHNLPAQATPFIGREVQIAAIKALMLDPEVHLVTLLGPGGTGKTRLSLQAAQEVLDQFPQGTYFVPLAEDREADQLVARIAQQLEVRDAGRPLLENVKDYLRDKSVLLILDNFEQLAAAAPLVSDLLATAPQLKILVTSRVALNLQGEREFPVPPLDLPVSPGEVKVEALAENEAVRLFVGRAQAVQPNFTLSMENARAVADICRRLDGLPLALELAAARVKLLPPQAILRRLDDRLKLLTGGARDLPARHQTLRGTLEWSYGLLNADERTLYTRLGVFVGGFTLEAAETVCNKDGRLDILEGLTSLVNNSLVQQEATADGEPRFGMLETIRAYALEKLAESGEMGALQERHARYYGGVIINQAGLGLYSAKAQTWLNWIEGEIDNVRATLNWSLAAPAGPEFEMGLIWSLLWFCYRRGYLSEGRTWSERMLASPAIQKASAERAVVLTCSGILALWQGEQNTGLAQIKEGLAIELSLENEAMLAYMLLGMGVALINMGRDSEARSFFHEAQTLFKQQNMAYNHIFTVVHLGNVELGLGNADKALGLIEEAYAEARAINENWLLSFALNNLGEVARTQGQYEQAQSYYEACEELLRDTGDRGDMARFAHSLGYIAQYKGDYRRAEAQFRKSLKMFRRLGNRRGMAECMAGLAGLKARQGQAEWGATLLRAAETVLQATDGAWWPADRVEVERNQEIIRSALSEADLAAAQKKGEAMNLEQALAFATQAA
jgi:predicted ATPase